MGKTLIIGAGPAGLTAGYYLAKHGRTVAILEGSPTHVGGISRTIDYNGFKIDIGGHRFFSKSQEIEDLWTELLPNDFLVRERSSKIFYRGQFYTYPLAPLEAARKLGWWSALLCFASFLKIQIKPVKNPTNFEDWVSNQFGRRLYAIFFKSYTEKVWGVDGKFISSDWAAQRIGELSLLKALISSFRFSPSPKKIKTLIRHFRYPRSGPGMLWTETAAKLRKLNGEIQMGARVTKLKYSAEAKTWSVSFLKDGEERLTEGWTDIISSAPLSELTSWLEPRLTADTLNVSRDLRYRHFIIVCLILRDEGKIKENWLYIHDSRVRVGRIQNFKSWSPEMVPKAEYCSYGMEYFCSDHDEMWNKSDSELIKVAKEEIQLLGLAMADQIEDATVVRQAKAYPLYTPDYQNKIVQIRSEIETSFPTLHLVGRNGMHKYNNQDHAMMTALIVAKNILAGKKELDPWCVNVDAIYQESQIQ